MIFRSSLIVKVKSKYYATAHAQWVDDEKKLLTSFEIGLI